MALETFFKTVLSLSFMGSIMAGMIILIKRLFNNKLSASWHYYIWFLMIARLIMPYTPESPLSIFNLFPETSPVFETEQYIVTDNNAGNIANVTPGDNDLQAFTVTETDTVSNTQSRLTEKVNLNVQKKYGFYLNFKQASIIYAAGAAIIMLYIIVINLMLLLRTKKYICRDDNVLKVFSECKEIMKVKKDIPIIIENNIRTPSLFGLAKPKLMISSEIIDALSEEERRYVFMHELAHLKRKDNFVNWIMLLVQILHWFNPIVWFAFRKMREDCEVACDAYVLSRLNEAEHKKYGETIINLIKVISKPSWISITAGMSSSRSGLKKRIRMIAMFRKNPWKWSVAAVIIILAAGIAGLTNKVSIQKQTGNQEVGEYTYQENSRSDVAKIEISFGEWSEPISITDSKIINDIMAMIEESKPVTDESRFDDMSGVARRNNKIIITQSDGGIKEVIFSYDYLYETGYIETDGEKAEPDYSFFRYIASLFEYANPDTSIEHQVLQLFGKYNWTVDYRINTLTEKLPGNLKHKAGEYPVKIYWAYNSELSKEIGLDFTGYLGHDVTVDIYRLREPLPEFMNPNNDARGIILKYKGEIVGAYIDAGRHNSFACSLNRKTLTDITGKQWDEWIETYIDYEDELEIRLSRMEPEDIIREYFNALDRNDIKAARACMTRRMLSEELSRNLDNNYLYNRDKEVNYNINSAKLLEIKQLKGFANEQGVLEYQVMVDFDFVIPVTSEDGVWPRFVRLKKESEKSGWRIDSIGTG